MNMRTMQLGDEQTIRVQEAPPNFAAALRGEVRRETLRVCSNWQFDCHTEWQNFPVAVNAHRGSGKIIIHCPGTEGSIRGSGNKYDQLADHLQQAGAAFVRTNGPWHVDIKDGPNYEALLTEKCSVLIDYALQNAEDIGGKPRDETEVYLMGVSAGAQGMVQVCGNFPQIKKVLLLIPAGPVAYEDSRRHLARYDGEVITVAAENDALVQLEVSEYAYRPDGARFIVRTGAAHGVDLEDLIETTKACLLELAELPEERYMEF